MRQSLRELSGIPSIHKTLNARQLASSVAFMFRNKMSPEVDEL
jgi:hypothetical protein